MAASDNNMLFKAFTAIYYISWIFIGNFILLNLFLAILIDGFAAEDAELDAEIPNEAEQAEAEIRKQRRLREEKQKRIKKLGTSMVDLQKLKTSNFQQKVNIKQKKKQRANFTGTMRLREADLDDIEDMSPEEIRRMLVDTGFLKARKSDNIDKKLVEPDVIFADDSVYLFNRHGCFRRNCHFV